ncbi:hypothetical protein [Cognatilysobacter tabacisoli]|uniref:hypothetical protein n=1 Tax=Cognatilysobacter tabacisoli TaxID=2315424 RepID=UPI000E6B2DB5|nr:hypothetical protein [Lysobacter tabacisoli]
MRKLFKPMATMALALFLTATAPSAFAAKALDLDSIRTQQAEIRQGIEARTGRYASLSADKRTALLVKQTNLLKTLEGKTTADDLSEHQRVEVFNTLEWIEAAINGTEGEELICRREKTIGSTRLTRVCRTAAEEARMKEEARRRMLEGSIDGSR